MNIKPLFDRVVVKPIKAEEESVGNIILPELTKKPEVCEVVSLGVGDIKGSPYTFTVKVGDRVLFNRYSGSDFVVNNESFIIIKEIDILGILEN